MLKLYENIKTYRKAAKLTQEELAKRTGYTDRSSIARIEKGEIDLPQSKIKQFAEALGTTPGVLMGLVSESTSKKNDAMVGVVSKMRSDPDFFEVVTQLAELPAGEYDSIKLLISSLRNK